jgi:hypothetical protein
MKKIIALLLLAKVTICWGQLDDSQKFLKESVNQTNLIKEEFLSNFSKIDLSQIWLGKRPIFGFIGNNFQRFRIKYNVVIKNINNPYIYNVSGQVQVNSVVNDYVGEIKLLHIRKIHNELKEDEIKIVEENFQNLNDSVKFELENLKSPEYELIADYLFNEKKQINCSGVLKGVLKSLFYIKGNEVYYYDLDSGSDNFSNNLFVGIWSNCQGDSIKRCNWGDYRIPYCEDLDIGEGEFYPDPKYLDNDWDSYRKSLHKGKEILEKALYW